MQATLRQQLGLVDGMSTYFMRAPTEYWQAIGRKQQPYDDNVGEYDFIHAFFASTEELSNFADILISKANHETLIWISVPELSESCDITDDSVNEILTDHDLSFIEKLNILNGWRCFRFSLNN